MTFWTGSSSRVAQLCAIVAANAEKRESVLDKAGHLRLKTMNQERGQRIRVEPDLTPQQRRDYDAMWEDARERSKVSGKHSGNGEKWVVLGPMDSPRLIKLFPQRTHEKSN